ncbi:dihydrofolate reductase family protein [Cellulomonas sp. ATA003]|uniref:dihydrofolate reductase family protein n=1 Tax=Cellulomonas sp. ATA003 TaxID=3073064 RepID=UPI002873CB0C|nr:dihydrofolate reductase family protein [Cellulomonas sp. ATA003]WNB84411.1 dihydrofolate reductase family protein [Cellulomonas sp. ATA003]
MIATLDGAGTGADGRSGSINGPADHRVFDVLRSLADVVVVGAGTVRAEGYGDLSVRRDLRAARAARGQHADPELAVVTRSGSVPDELLDAAVPPLVVTAADGDAVAALRRRIGADRVVAVGTGDVDLGGALAALAARGLPRVLTEGGPRLLGDLLAADLVDDLCLTTAPLVVGGPARRVVDRGGWLAPPAAARCAHLLHGDGVLLGRWLLDGPRSGALD